MVPANYTSAKMHADRQQEEEEDRLLTIMRAWDYYEGRHPDQLQTKSGEVNDNIKINLARPIVDKGISFLFGKEVTWQLDESAAQTSDAEKWLAAIWKANKKMSLLQEVGQNGAMAGLAAIKIDPQAYNLPGQKKQHIRLINLDPSCLQLFWNHGDIDDVYMYRIEYTADDQGREVTHRQDIKRVDRLNHQSTWTLTNYEIEDGQLPKQIGEPIAWDYPFAPIVHCKNLPRANTVWGYGDLEDIKLNDAFNLIASTVRKTLRIHSSPQTIGEGVTAQQLKRNAAGMWEIPKDSKVYNLEMQSDLQSSHQFYLALRAAIYGGARTPDMSSYQGNLGQLTNFGLRVLFADLLEKTEQKHLLYGDMIEQLNYRLCFIGGWKDTSSTLTWADPLPVDQLAKANETLVKQQTGIPSDETLAGELGYKYTDELKRREDEQSRKQVDAGQLGDAMLRAFDRGDRAPVLPNGASDGE